MLRISLFDGTAEATAQSAVTSVGRSSTALHFRAELSRTRKLCTTHIAVVGKVDLNWDLLDIASRLPDIVFQDHHLRMANLRR